MKHIEQSAGANILFINKRPSVYLWRHYARVVNEEEFAVRRNEILDAVQRLVFTKGYQQMSIQDILDDLHMSKRAFYHYFASNRHCWKR